MLQSRLDHLVVTATRLEEGVAHIRRALGVAPQAGGKHHRMGTHNCVLKLGPRVYLEVIAPNPAAPDPGRPRWFGLDAPNSEGIVRLAAWVSRTNDISAAAAASPLHLGTIEPMQRGSLDWQICIPGDGDNLMEGIAPMLIQWQGTHPADGMNDLGCTLKELKGFHPEPQRVKAVLKAIGFTDHFPIGPSRPGEPPHLEARIQTPSGERVLKGL